MKTFKDFVKESYGDVLETTTNLFSKDHLDKLRSEYETMQKIDPTSKSYKSLIDLLNKLPQENLKQLSSANIKFISPLAKNRIKKESLEERCWDGYKPTPGKTPYETGSCMKEDEDLQEEAEHEGEKVTLNKPFRTPDGPKKFAVYVKNDKGNVVKVTFGDPDMEIKRDSEDRRSNFRARHNCDEPGPKDKARYWSCKMWSNTPVSKLTENTTEMDISSAAKLFQKFLRSTGAPDKNTAFRPSNKTPENTIFIGTSTNSKFDYLVDLSKRTVTATQPHTMGRPHSYVWDDKTGEVKMVEGVVVENPHQTPKSKMDK